MPQRRAVPTLTTLCLQNLAQHMQSLWTKDYSDNYLDEYEFRFLVGPFNDLGEVWGWFRASGYPCGGSWGCQDSLTSHFPPASGLVQELLQLLGASRRLSRAALHLLLLPHLRQLSLRPCPALANNALGHLIVLRCQVGRGDSGGGAHLLWGWESGTGVPWSVGVGLGVTLVGLGMPSLHGAGGTEQGVATLGEQCWEWHGL